MPVRYRVLLIVAFAIVAGVIWAIHRETPTQKQINRALAELRASDEPIEAQDLARMYPDSAAFDDANVIYAAAFAVATNHPPPQSTPFVVKNVSPPLRLPPFEFTAQMELTQYLARTAAITKALPRAIPENARFPLHWERGVTNWGSVNFVRARALIHLLATRALAAAELGDADEASLMIEHGFRFSKAMRFDGFIVEHMIRHASENLMCSAAERALNRMSFSDEQLRRIGASIGFESPGDLVVCARAQHCSAIWAFRAAQSGVPRYELFHTPRKSTIERMIESIQRCVANGKPYYRDADFLSYLRLIPRQLEWCRMPPLKAIDVSSCSSSQFATNWVSEVGEGLAPRWQSMFASHAQAETKLLCLATTIAVERFRIAHMRLPNSLDELVPTCLAAVPTDPFSSAPLRYRPLTTGFVVYSVGKDGRDDGGIEVPTLTSPTNTDLIIRIDR